MSTSTGSKRPRARLQKPRKNADGSTSWRVDWIDGTRRPVKTFGTEQAARRFAALIEAIGSAGALEALKHDDAATVRTVGEQLTHHIEHLTSVTDGTRRRYEQIAKRDIVPHLGGYPVTVLSADNVASWVLAMRRAGASPKTIKNRHSLLSSALQSAMQSGLIERNVAKGVKLPRVDTPEMTFLTQDEFACLVEMAPLPWRPLVLFLGATGLRWGEATALTVADVDLGASQIRVHQAWKEHRGGGHVVGPPKTRRGVRTVALPRVCRGYLEDLTSGREPVSFLFTNSRGGPVRHRTFHAEVWQPLVHAFAGDERRQVDTGGRPKTEWVESGRGKRPRIHDLRHSFASWAISAGHPLTAIQRTMGHESITTTSDRYGHLFRADRDAFADLVAVSGETPQTRTLPATKG